MQSATYKKMKKLAPDLEETFSPDNFEIFKGLSSADVGRIVDAGVIRSVDSGKMLYRKGDMATDVYLILRGKVQIVDEYDGHKKSLAEFVQGDFFGEMSMFEKAHTRSTHAIVKEPSRLLVIKNDVLNKLIDKKLPKRFLKNIIIVLYNQIRINHIMYMRARYHDKSSKDVRWQG
jgi:CRP/FNR family cyclic AMP-dependent transcriptional regulator